MTLHPCRRRNDRHGGRNFFVLLRPFRMLWLMCIVGCTALPGDNVFTIKQTDVNVHWKMTQYNSVGPFGGITTTQAQMVDEANKAYQEALKQAVKEAHGDMDAPTPPYLQQKANQLIQVLSSVMSTLTRNFRTAPAIQGV